METHRREGSCGSRAIPKGERSSGLMLVTPILGSCTGEKEGPKHLALETNRPYVWELWELWGAKILLLRDVCSLTNPGTWYKGNS